MNNLEPWQLADTIVAAADCDVVVAVTVEHSTNVRWAMSTPTTNAVTRIVEVWITAVVEQNGGWCAATRSGSPTQWPTLLAQAHNEAEQATPSREGAELLAGHSIAGFDHPALTADPMAIPVELADAFTQSDVEYFGYAEQDTTTVYVATSSGWRWRETSQSARFEVSAKSTDRTRSAWAGRSASQLDGIDVTEALADVRTGLAAQIRSEPVAAQPWPVILSPSATADLMLECWRNAIARDATEGRSAYSGSGPAGTTLGERLTARQLRMESNPDAYDFGASHRLWTPWSSAQASVFDTGAELTDVRWFDNGFLTALAATRAASGQLDLPFVASSDCLAVSDEDGAGSLPDVIARTDRAVLITSLWYIRDVDPQQMLVTGLTRDGTYLVRDGEVVGSAGNFRFNESPLHMLSRITDVGTTVRCLPREWADYFTRTAMPPVTVDGFGLSTASVAI
jgi:predicted Zn-dependent protease